MSILPSQLRRLRPFLRKKHVHGMPPGTLFPIADAPPTTVHVMGFSPDDLMEGTLRPGELQEIPQWLAKWPVVWIDVRGLGDVETIRTLGSVLSLHPLALEDVMNLGQRAKVDAYGNHMFAVVQMVVTNDHIAHEQLGLFLGDGFVVSFQERPEDTLSGLHERVRNARGRIRGCGADYLLYAVLDTVVDGYFPVLDDVGERLEDLEDELSQRCDKGMVRHIHAARHDLRVLRRAVWPLREALTVLLRDPLPHVTEATRVYLRDCYDHAVHARDVVETFIELSADLLNLYTSFMGQRLNEVMKVLTIIATIFIPLSFVVGLYGMNFNPAVSHWNMPELNWAYGYPAVLGVMLAMAAGMVVYFWRKGWLR